MAPVPAQGQARFGKGRQEQQIHCGSCSSSSSSGGGDGSTRTYTSIKNSSGPAVSVGAAVTLDPPESPPDTPPLSCLAINPDGSSSPSSKGVPNSIKFVDLSVKHDFHSDLLPTPEFVKVHQHVSNIIQQRGGCQHQRREQQRQSKYENKRNNNGQCCGWCRFCQRP